MFHSVHRMINIYIWTRVNRVMCWLCCNVKGWYKRGAMKGVTHVDYDTYIAIEPFVVLYLYPSLRAIVCIPTIYWASEQLKNFQVEKKTYKIHPKYRIYWKRLYDSRTMLCRGWSILYEWFDYCSVITVLYIDCRGCDQICRIKENVPFAWMTLCGQIANLITVHRSQC